MAGIGPTETSGVNSTSGDEKKFALFSALFSPCQSDCGLVCWQSLNRL
jgi:hypothetical protein